jgi:rhodanese-related sulfurtransferase
MRSNWADGGYNHWVAFLGFEKDRIRIVDPPHPAQTISPAELLANWDGTAVVLSKEKVDASFLAAARSDYFLIVGLILLATFLVRKNLRIANQVDRNSSLTVRLRSSVMQVAVLVILAVGVGLVFHALSDIGFLRNPTALAEVKRRYYSVDIPELTLEETVAEIEQKDPLVLDARRVRDFQRGTLPGAESMSLFSSLPERQQVLAGVPKSKRIIVFCQSAGCGYADEIAKFLKFNGYENLVIYREGYRRWKEEKVEPEKEESNPSPE